MERDPFNYISRRLREHETAAIESGTGKRAVAAFERAVAAPWPGSFNLGYSGAKP